MRAFKNSKYHDSVQNVKKFMFEDIDRTLSLKTKAPNFLLALGLCCYTEYWGKLKLGQDQNGMSRSPNLNYVNGLLGAVLVFSISAVLFSVLSWRVQEYKYVVGTGTVDRSSLVPIQTSAPTAHANRDEAYQASIAKNSQKNRTKRDLSEVSQWLFFIAIFFISIFTIWLLISPMPFPS